MLFSAHPNIHYRTEISKGSMSTTKQDSKQFPPSVDIEPKIAPQEVVLSGATSFHSVYKF